MVTEMPQPSTKNSLPENENKWAHGPQSINSLSVTKHSDDLDVITGGALKNKASIQIWEGEEMV